MEELKAVALKYPKDSEAPFIAAKGRGELAKKIIEIANENKVPIVQNDLAANVLTLSEIGSIIPEETWEIIAHIFSLLVKTDKRI